MAVTNYYSAGGAIIGERTAGSPRIDYLTDALGSVTATVDQTGAVQNTYRYKPYGAQLEKTGTSADPKFTWVGTQGYRQAAGKYSDIYIRARSYSRAMASWITKDGFRNTYVNLYGYCLSSPTSLTDPSGLGPGSGQPVDCSAAGDPIDKSKRKSIHTTPCQMRVCAIVAQLRNIVDDIADAMCGGTDEGPGAIFECGQTQLCLGNLGKSCDVDPPVGSPCWVDDTGGPLPHFCCQRCKQCVCMNFTAPENAAINAWMLAAFLDCYYHLPLPPFPGIVNPCPGGGMKLYPLPG